MSEETTRDICEPQRSTSRRENDFRSSEQDLDESCRYKIDCPEKSRCVIIHMEHFKNLDQRTGTDKDAAALENIFKTMEFKVDTLKDKTCQEIRDFLKAVAEEDHSKRSCFVCIIMSHGDEKGIYGNDDHFSTESVFSLFEENVCSSLAGKPKLFFIQACRGESYDSGFRHYSGADEEPTGTPEICIDIDFLCHYSTPLGYSAWRNDNGSWFIQKLCKMLKKYWKIYDLMHILTLVNNEVARNCTSNTGARLSHGMKQMPCIVSKLTKDLYLYK
ncbi:caspase-3-like isoform 1-T2 [Mantella aurantiaca]